MRVGIAAAVAVLGLSVAPAALAAWVGEAAPRLEFRADDGETNDVVALKGRELIYVVDLGPNVIEDPYQCDRVWRRGKKMLNEVRCDMRSNQAAVELKDGDDRVKLIGFDHGGVLGGPGNDRIYGGGGEDRLRGDEGNDRIYGRGAADDWFPGDELEGGAGDDVIDSRGGRLRDRVRCGEGKDTVKADRRDRVGRDCERVFRAKPRR